MAIQIKEGRYYKDGIGSVGGPATHRPLAKHPWIIPFECGLRMYSDDGLDMCAGHGLAGWNLISECDAEGNPIEDAMSEAEQLVMKEGAYYEDGFGEVFGPCEPNYDKTFTWQMWSKSRPFLRREYTSTGSYGHDCDKTLKDFDLVREVPATSAPEAPKPETVTVTQEMVDRAILDAVKAGNPAWADEINHAWVGMQRVLEPQTDDGWIPWKGGMPPIDGETQVQLKLQDGSISVPGQAAGFAWGCADFGYGIVAYRIVK